MKVTTVGFDLAERSPRCMRSTAPARRCCGSGFHRGSAWRPAPLPPALVGMEACSGRIPEQELRAAPGAGRGSWLRALWCPIVRARKRRQRCRGDLRGGQPPSMRHVPVKSAEQQASPGAAPRAPGLTVERTGTIDELRQAAGRVRHRAARGVLPSCGPRRFAVLEDTCDAVPSTSRDEPSPISMSASVELDQKYLGFNQELEALARHSDAAERLTADTISGRSRPRRWWRASPMPAVRQRPGRPPGWDSYSGSHATAAMCAWAHHQARDASLDAADPRHPCSALQYQGQPDQARRCPRGGAGAPRHAQSGRRAGSQNLAHRLGAAGSRRGLQPRRPRADARTTPGRSGRGDSSAASTAKRSPMTERSRPAQAALFNATTLRSADDEGPTPRLSSGPEPYHAHQPPYLEHAARPRRRPLASPCRTRRVSIVSVERRADDVPREVRVLC